MFDPVCDSERRRDDELPAATPRADSTNTLCLKKVQLSVTL